jgi:hypothetical protein
VSPSQCDSPRKSRRVVTSCSQSVRCLQTVVLQDAFFHKCNRWLRIVEPFLASRSSLTCQIEFNGAFPDSSVPNRGAFCPMNSFRDAGTLHRLATNMRKREWVRRWMRWTFGHSKQRRFLFSVFNVVYFFLTNRPSVRNGLLAFLMSLYKEQNCRTWCVFTCPLDCNGPFRALNSARKKLGTVWQLTAFAVHKTFTVTVHSSNRETLQLDIWTDCGGFMCQVHSSKSIQVQAVLALCVNEISYGLGKLLSPGMEVGLIGNAVLLSPPPHLTTVLRHKNNNNEHLLLCSKTIFFYISPVLVVRRGNTGHVRALATVRALYCEGCRYMSPYLCFCRCKTE